MIQPWRENPYYWQYKERPLLLIGGSREDNLFQISGLAAHLETLVASGGNYVRCTLSSRDEGDLWPYHMDGESGLYDLNRFNPEYWNRFESFLQSTAALDIIVQIEIWDRFDFSRAPWQANPFNPRNNCNYTPAASGLDVAYPAHPNQNLQPFFYSVPTLNNNTLLLQYQQVFVEKMLAYTLGHDHILYCMDNETNGAPAWGVYWANFIRQRAQSMGQMIYLTEMWDCWDITDQMHAATFDHPELYAFVDISQNNHISGETHWKRIQTRRADLCGPPRPLNMVKIYGATGNKFGHTNDEGIARFWRALFGGIAALRFHRPPSGLGLNPLAQANLKSARLLLDEVDLWDFEPDADFQLFNMRDIDGAYLTNHNNEQFVVYFPGSGTARLNLKGDFSLRWLDILGSGWLAAEDVSAAVNLPLSTPGNGHWLVFITRKR